MDSADIPFGPPPSDTPPPEQIPLVVPDVQDAKANFRDRTGPLYCKAIKKNGKKCGWCHWKNSEYCYLHDPAVSEEERQANRRKTRFPRIPGRPKTKVKTLKDVLELISGRLDQFIERYGAAPTPQVEETICEMVKTFVQVYKCNSDADALGIAQFSLKRRQA